MAGCIALALLLPQPTQADCRPQLQPFCLLAAGDSKSLPKADLCFLHLVPCAGQRQQEFTLEPMQLGLVEPHPTLVHSGQCLGQDCQALCGLSALPIPFGQQSKKMARINSAVARPTAAPAGQRRTCSIFQTSQHSPHVVCNHVECFLHDVQAKFGLRVRG
jgi:hypothetical protein